MLHSLPATVTPIVHIGRRRQFTSATLPAPDLESLAAAYRAAPWWRERLKNPRFRAAARDVLRRHGSLVLLGPSVNVQNAPPFAELFEPIEFSAGLGDASEQIRTVAGEAPRRTDWSATLVVLFAATGILALALLALPLLRVMPPAAFGFLAAVGALVGLIIAGALLAQRRGGRWFLVPGAIAVVRPPARRGQPARVTVLARRDSCLVYRLVSNGKTTTLFVELWTHAGQTFRRPVSSREAAAILAAWQSPHPPPPDERLQELVSW